MKVESVSLRIPVVVLLVVGLLAAQRGIAYAQAPTDPEHNFEVLWKTFDVNYALFNAKHVDWQALYNIYRPQVTPKTTDSALFAIMSRMLSHLNDNHVQLRSATPQWTFSAGYLWDFFGKAGMAKFTSLNEPPARAGEVFQKAVERNREQPFRVWVA